MRFDLKTPCKNCPFADRPERIRFAGRSRATEIAETAYRHGFPCHLSAVYQEDEEGENDGYVPGPKAQHCAGALAMLAQDSMGSPWPGIGNSDNRLDQISIDLEGAFPLVFASEDAFIEANADPRIDGA